MIKFMVIFLIVLSITSLLTAQSSSSRTLNYCYESFSEVVSEYPSERNFDAFSKLKEANHDCVKEQMNLSENGNKVVGRNYCKIFTVTSFWLCTPDPLQLINLKINELIETLPGKFEKIVNCSKNSLKEIEPSAAIVGDFDSEAFVKSEEYAEMCQKNEEAIKFNLGGKAIYDESNLNEVSCGSIKVSDLDKYLHTLLILKFAVTDEIVKKDEIELIKNAALEKMKNVNACLNEKINVL